MNSEFLRIKDAAGLLGVTPLTLRNWDKKGVLVAYRHPVNNYRLYRTADVQNLLARVQQRGMPNPDPARLGTYPSGISEEVNDVAPIPPVVQRLPVVFEDEV